MTSVFRGLSLGLVAYFVGGFFFLPVFFLGSFAGLVPVVGSAMIWLPLASLVWSRGDSVTALLLATLSLVLNYGISRFRAGMGNRLHQQGAWLSFMLFLGIIGGLLSYGLQGLVIGPMAVILAYGLIRFLSGQSLQVTESLVGVVNYNLFPHILALFYEAKVNRVGLIIIMCLHIL